MIYCFECYESESGCGHKFDVVCEMSEIIGLKPKCPKCRKKSTVFRNYENEQVTPYDPTPKTLGSLAEQNTKKYSKEQREEMTKNFNSYLENPFTGPTPTGATTSEEITKRANKKKKEIVKAEKSKIK
jgi:ABC-type transporter MlaC component